MRNYTKTQIETMVKDMLKDIKKPYFEHMPFKIDYVNNVTPLFINNEIENAWDVTVYVQEDQFPDKDEYAIIIIIINDDTGDIESYADMSCGRPVPLKAVLNNGKYEFKSL